jgi:hypothetical protein
MNTLTAYLWRLLVITTGFGLATCAAALFFFVTFLIPEFVAEQADADWFAMILSALLLGIFIASIAAAMIAVPVLVLAIISEFFGLRSLWFHTVAGLVLGGGASLLWMGGIESGEWDRLAASAASGIIGALVYWLIAGRNAGRLFDRITQERQARLNGPA